MLRTVALTTAALVLGACGGEAPRTGDVEAGLQMYRNGILPSGEPMTALVGGDVPIVGTQFSCENCHGRSGMGASEGAFVIPPVAAQFLYEASAQPERPAYDDESLARLLRDGVTPGGRTLSVELMPRYELADADVGVLATFLETLSPGNSPGVDDSAIRFATIVTVDVDPAERDAVLAVFNEYFDEINRETRNEGARWDRGYKPESKLPTVFREWVLDEWVLTGPSDTWDEQLERYYTNNNVFAVVGGLGTASWAPVAEFCERNHVPCLYPSVEQPHHDDGDFYTVYFSGGLLLEAGLIAQHLADDVDTPVTQVYCDDRLEPAVAALRNAFDTGHVQDLKYDCDSALPVSQLASGNTVLWLDKEHINGLPDTLPAGRYYASSTLLDATVPDALAQSSSAVFMAHPFKLPGKSDAAMRRFEIWARTRDIDITSPRRQAEALFACLVIKDAVKHMGRFFIREYALDMMDHAEGMAAYMPVHARPSFGPGQRFINKGGYILPVIAGQPAVDQAQWILP